MLSAYITSHFVRGLKAKELCGHVWEGICMGNAPLQESISEVYRVWAFPESSGAAKPLQVHSSCCSVPSLAIGGLQKDPKANYKVLPSKTINNESILQKPHPSNNAIIFINFSLGICLPKMRPS